MWDYSVTAYEIGLCFDRALPLLSDKTRLMWRGDGTRAVNEREIEHFTCQLPCLAVGSWR